jgi:6,7-dimethyl-8-ribityllumazine synthase
MPTTHSGVVRGSGRRVGIVCARFNEEITSRLLAGARRALDEAGVAADAVVVAHVPGAVEVPLVAAALLRRGRVDAVVALGAVIRGETGHYESVCRMVEDGLVRVMLECGKPVGFGVLTCDDEKQAFERSGQDAGNKGAEAALAALEMASLLEEIAR